MRALFANFGGFLWYNKGEKEYHWAIIMKTLFVSDLDGTLLTRHENVSAYSKEHLNRLLERGMAFTYATARSVGTALRAIDGLQIRLPAVFYNGGLIYDAENRTVLRASFLREEEKKYILSVLVEHSIDPVVFGVGDGRERLSWFVGKENPGVLRSLERRRADERLSPAHSDAALLWGDVYYFKCIGPREQLESAWNVLKMDDRFICIFHQETYQNDFWMEISPREATKANAVRYLKERLGFERLICFGDTANDSDMFDVCDECYAVQNADDWLKAKATGVIGYCEEDGVAKWLDAHAAL